MQRKVITILIFLLSTVVIFNFFTREITYNEILRLVVAVLGVTLYFSKGIKYKVLLLIWISSQLIIIKKNFFSEDLATKTVQSLFDLVQIFSLRFSFFYEVDNYFLSVEFNVLAIIYLIIAGYLMDKNYI